ncbi:hypothetical protein NliqN6_6457 [Naganishia liquefaciens]|uniref:Methyltransferase domain-containing protein n=1 Tax=Naganishia liquefaciens TaxID=104408 RepID=A0A8H3YHJ4_9TREE|nr:hypothetical protein NliqN6_6457 [Naganishia liquefaciens]
MSPVQGLPEDNTGYGTQEYWEKRYASEGQDSSFDWFLQPEYLLPLLEPYLLECGKGKDVRVLMLGCGNSLLGEVMYDAGYHNVVNVDYSAILIAQMRARHAELRPDMQWLEMDIRDLKFNEGDFDVVLDKGTMDAMLTSKGDVWNPPEEDVQNCRKEVEEAVRVLAKQKGSRFLYATFGQPHFRRRYMLGHAGFALTHRDIGPPEGFSYFLYDLQYAAAL